MKTVVKLHTIEQWFQLDVGVRQVILQNIKIRDRLYKWLGVEGQKPDITEPIDIPCRHCGGTGIVTVEPRYDGLHPSQIGHPCLLRIYNEMMGVGKKEKIEPRVKLIFELGHKIHDIFQGFGEKGAWGAQYRKEVEISSRYQQLAALLEIEGHADADNILIVDDIPNSPHIYEVGVVHEYKSINSNGFKGLTKPKPEHKQQAMLYSAALNRPVVVYLYMNKDDQNLKDFPVEFDHPLWSQVYNKAALLKNHVDAGTPPEAYTGFHCEDCGYKHQCGPYKDQMFKKKF